MSKAIFRWNSDGIFVSSDVKPDDYQLKENETFDEPKFDDPTKALTPYKRVSNGWVASSQEEHDAYEKKQFELEHPGYKEQPVQPSEEQEMINALGKQQMNQGSQITANTADIKQVKAMINYIGKQQMNDTKQNGGN